MGTFQSAASSKLRHEDEAAEAAQSPRNPLPPAGQQAVGGILTRDDWVKAVINGGDDRSPRWRHIMVIAGVLLGFEGQEKHGLSRTLRKTVGDTFVRALNMALVEVRNGEELGASYIALVLNYSFQLLSETERLRIDYDVSICRTS